MDANILRSMAKLMERESDEPGDIRGLRAKAVHWAADEIQNADRALCELLGEFGWATGHGDTLADLISELAVNMRIKWADEQKHAFALKHNAQTK